MVHSQKFCCLFMNSRTKQANYSEKVMRKIERRSSINDANTFFLYSYQTRKLFLNFFFLNNSQNNKPPDGRPKILRPGLEAAHRPQISRVLAGPTRHPSSSPRAVVYHARCSSAEIPANTRGRLNRTQSSHDKCAGRNEAIVGSGDRHIS